MLTYCYSKDNKESWSDRSGLREVAFPSVIGFFFLCELCLGLVSGDTYSFSSEVTAVGDSSPTCVSLPLLHINCSVVQTQITFIFPPFSTFDIKVLQGHCLYLLSKTDAEVSRFNGRVWKQKGTITWTMEEITRRWPKSWASLPESMLPLAQASLRKHPLFGPVKISVLRRR